MFGFFHSDEICIKILSGSKEKVCFTCWEKQNNKDCAGGGRVSSCIQWFGYNVTPPVIPHLYIYFLFHVCPEDNFSSSPMLAFSSLRQEIRGNV